MGRVPRHTRRRIGGRWRAAAAGVAVVVVGATAVQVQAAGAEGRRDRPAAQPDSPRGDQADGRSGEQAGRPRWRADRHHLGGRARRPSPSATPTTPAPTTATPAPTTPPRTTTAPPATNPSGQPMPVGDLPGWKQTFTEDFSAAAPRGSFPGPVYGPKWGAYAEGWKDTSRQGTYSPGRTLSAADGLLRINLRTENGAHLVAAPTPKLPGGAYGQTYGRYSVRFRADPVRGYKTAWLLWPDSDDWDEGEIDFPEGGLDGKIHAFAHYAGAPRSQDAFATDATYTSWHTATIEWSPGRVAFLLDGRSIGVSTTKVPSTPMHLVLQTETCIGCTTPDDAAGDVEIDWVAIWSRTG